MCLTIENGLVSLWTISSFRYHPTYFADEMYKHGLIPNEVKDGVYRLYETGKITDHHLKCRILQAVKDFIATNERENVQQVIRMNFKLWYKFAEFGIYSRNNFYGIEAMKDDLCKLLCVRGKGMGLIYNVYSTTSTNSTSISIS